MTCNNCKKNAKYVIRAERYKVIQLTVASSSVNSVNVRKGLESLNAMREVDLKHF